MHCFSFDIETVPDVEFGRRLWDLDGVVDKDVATAMTFKQLQKSGREFLPLHQHRVVAISVALRTGDSFTSARTATTDFLEEVDGGFTVALTDEHERVAPALETERRVVGYVVHSTDRAHDGRR